MFSYRICLFLFFVSIAGLHSGLFPAVCIAPGKFRPAPEINFAGQWHFVIFARSCIFCIFVMGFELFLLELVI